jgi:hypothetical protein
MAAPATENIISLHRLQVTANPPITKSMGNAVLKYDHTTSAEPPRHMLKGTAIAAHNVKSVQYNAGR